ncbi:MAG: murein biosynthesis integral membrane protein MurJ [Planctomycetia bacterium]|nr:murein biosynthesis integral membrane protein MurJ [Planctomycetia bacterium]
MTESNSDSRMEPQCKATAISPATTPQTALTRHANVFSSLTLLSRIFGLLRDKACSYFLGVGTTWSAFWMGFQFPNLFRRIFGEGALTAVFLPVYTRIRQENGQDTADQLARSVIRLLLITLTSITMIGEVIVIPMALSHTVLPANRLAAAMIAIMLPFSIAICLVALLAAIATASDRFAAQAVAPIITNVAMTLGAAIPVWIWTRHFALTARIYWVAGAVLISGVLQVLLLAIAVRRTGLSFRGAWQWRGPGVREIVAKMAPMILGLSAVQMNTFLDSQIAWWFSPDGHGGRTTFSIAGLLVHVPMLAGALGKLSVAQRIYLLPVGVFGVATATVIFPRLSEAGANQDVSRTGELLWLGLRRSLFISLPATLGMILISQPLITAIYLGGKVNTADVLQAVWTARWFCMGIWAFEMQMILVRVFYAWRDALTPMKVALGMVLLNIMLNLTLIWFLQEGGIAASTSISAMVQCVILLFILQRRMKLGKLGEVLRMAGKSLLGAAVMFTWGWICLLLMQHSSLLNALPRWLASVVELLILVPLAALIYGLLMRWWQAPELADVPILRRLAKR